MRLNGTAILNSLDSDTISKFWAMVDKRGPTECWLWRGPLSKGYGEAWLPVLGHRKRMRAHRVSYHLMVGTVPVGLALDHLCRNPQCVNPAHLEPVTDKVNTLRGVGITALNAAKTHCKHGHEFTPENTYWIRGGHRDCRECKRQQSAKRRALRSQLIQ